MGKFSYESILKVDFEDRLLAHLQLVIGAKMRRGESFHFTWNDDASTGDGRTTVWIHPRCSVAYKFYGSRKPSINRAWIDALLDTANTPSGCTRCPSRPSTKRRTAVPPSGAFLSKRTDVKRPQDAAVS